MEGVCSLSEGTTLRFTDILTFLRCSLAAFVHGCLAGLAPGTLDVDLGTTTVVTVECVHGLPFVLEGVDRVEESREGIRIRCSSGQNRRVLEMTISIIPMLDDEHQDVVLVRVPVAMRFAPTVHVADVTIQGIDDVDLIVRCPMFSGSQFHHSAS
jgi:hypothetical protein